MVLRAPLLVVLTLLELLNVSWGSAALCLGGLAALARLAIAFGRLPGARTRVARTPGLIGLTPRSIVFGILLPPAAGLHRLQSVPLGLLRLR